MLAAPSQSLLLAAVSTMSVPPPSASMRVLLMTGDDSRPKPLMPPAPSLVIVAAANLAAAHVDARRFATFGVPGGGHVQNAVVVGRADDADVDDRRR